MTQTIHPAPALHRRFLEGRTDFKTLTPRELLTVKLITIEFLNTKEIAQRLNLSPKTIESHKHNINRKLNIHSIAELTRRYIMEVELPIIIAETLRPKEEKPIVGQEIFL